MVRVWFALLCVSCVPEEDLDEQAVEDCSELCYELVVVCDVASYPDEASCQAGCLSGSDQGADTESQRACVGLAECDLFALLECEHDFGA
ncbi:MAG: hypothetical protein KTR31_38760 [Myxococcales bacterium]|nr:hypothetical protein [Myxococcales bacterium]